MTALLVLVGLRLLAYGGDSVVVLPKKPLARGAVYQWRQMLSQVEGR